MTNEELLAKIDEGGARAFQSDSYSWIALRAVVELHKPEQRCYDATCYCKDMCSKCKEDYPCSTVQVIQKELV